MKQQHHDIDDKTYQKGINSDTNEEILGSKEDGEHIDALNMRSVSMDGHNFAKKKIKGEKLLYPNVDNRCFLQGPYATLSDFYRCMMTQEVNDLIVEIWASTINNQFPFMRINGKIVLMSEFFPIDVEYPLQYDKNEACVGGEIYITNNVTPPMVFSIKDLMMNSGMTQYYEDAECTQKYFDEFNVEQYQVGITAGLHKPAFVSQDISSTGYNYDVVFGSLGIPVGMHSYSYRYVTPDGDRSQWSPVTELIPVLKQVDYTNNYFPLLRTRGDYPISSSSSGYGVHVRIRVENYLGFDFIEIRRDSWYTGSAISSPPASFIVGFADIIPGVSVLDILDRTMPVETEESIAIDDTGGMTALERAKSIRYFNQRLYLMNVGYASKDIEAEVEFLPGADLMFPIIHKMGKPGHKSPYNGAYYKSNMRGERYGFGLVLYDIDGNVSFVKKIDGYENYRFPNRRDVVSNLTNGMSYYGVPTAALSKPILNNLKVGACHEVFDHENASYRDGNLTANIFNGTWLINQDIPFAPFNPTGQNDTNSDYGQNVNEFVYSGNDISLPEDKHTYNPKIFGLNYYSMGIAFKGIDMSTIPGWASAFSIVQTKPANVVMAQGLGWYAMKQAEQDNFGDAWWGPNAGKATDYLWVYFPDADTETGIRPQVIDDLLNNFSNGSIKAQLVSPLGYLTEVYSFNNEIDKDEQGDLISYVRILHDEGQINPTMGINFYPEAQGILWLNKQYVGYGAFRALIAPSSLSNNQNGTNGDKLFTITDVQQITTPSGRSKYFQIRFSESIYAHQFVGDGGAGIRHEKNYAMRKWQEPMYVVNLIRQEASIIDSNVTQYNYTGHYQKFKSIIGEGTGSPLSLKVVADRWEDYVKQVSGMAQNPYWNLDRFIYVENAQGSAQKWLNVTFKSPADLAAIIGALQNNGTYQGIDQSGGYTVYGIYTTAEESINEHRTHKIKFIQYSGLNDAYSIPLPGAKIYIYYDNRIPVRVFGGDTWINESIWAPVDNEYGNNAKPIDSINYFRWNLPMPYNKYKLSDEITVLKDGSGAADHIMIGDGFSFDGIAFTRDRNVYNVDITKPAWVRQWVCMWTAETRTNLSYAFNNENEKNSLNQYFPLKNYVMRPNKWTTSNDFDNYADVLGDNKIYTQYYDLYGNEQYNWKYGGFRFRPQTNIDYAKANTTLNLINKPLFGFEEQTEFCTRIIWSEKRPINVQNTPTVRTFPAKNYYDISDDTGCINFAWSALSSDKGNNLYAITSSGIALLLVDKRVIHEINANELATVGSDVGGILNALWIDKQIGMANETWRSWAEYSNQLFFATNIGVFLFADNQLSNLTDTGFSELYRRKFVPAIGVPLTRTLAGGYNVLTKEYIMDAHGHKIVLTGSKKADDCTLIYGTQQQALQCQSTYSYEKYLYINNKLFGMKDAKTFELGIGNQIDGEDMEAYLTNVSDKQIYFDKEFIRIRVNANSKPDKIFIYNSYEDYKNDNYTSVVDATADPIAIKDYFGYECYIPRKEIAPFNRQQGRSMIFKITSTADEDFLITSTGVQYKLLK